MEMELRTHLQLRVQVDSEIRRIVGRPGKDGETNTHEDIPSLNGFIMVLMTVRNDTLL
jgi:hypothetical protein